MIRVTNTTNEYEAEEDEEDAHTIAAIRLEEEERGIKHVSGDILVDNAKAGRWSGVLVDRDRVGGSFFSVCDEVSSELQEVSGILPPPPIHPHYPCRCVSHLLRDYSVTPTLPASAEPCRLPSSR